MADQAGGFVLHPKPETIVGGGVALKPCLDPMGGSDEYLYTLITDRRMFAGRAFQLGGHVVWYEVWLPDSMTALPLSTELEVEG